ncbi:MAG: cobyrinate a,c-diamide synthase [Candidatus Binataceae bacterium]
MAAAIAIPRVVIGAVASGTGKTTITVAIAAALRARGKKIAVFKCGPDYLDPGYHRHAAGVISHNLDGWMMGREAVAASFARAAAGCDLAIVEGMMGLFDGATPVNDEGSTAEIAKWLGAPVILAIDVSGMARTLGAVAEGFRRFDPELRIAGLICNRVGGRGHLDLLRAATPPIGILGGFPEVREAAFPERHLGLVSLESAGIDDAIFGRWGALASEWLDLDAILEIANSAPPIARLDGDRVFTPAGKVKIGIAWDEAFHFYYEDNLARLETLGAELIRFSPASDRTMPEVDGLYFGGGYPEAHVRSLSSNTPMLESIRNFSRNGGIIYAECGGLMYLADAIVTLDGKRWPMAGLIAGDAVMSSRLQAIGYVEVTTRAPSILGGCGLSFRGHQFRYSTLERTGSRATQVYAVKPRWGGAPFHEGFSGGNVMASYVHAHWASNPEIAANFLGSCRRRGKNPGRPV